MKLTVRTLKRLIKEAVKEQLHEVDEYEQQDRIKNAGKYVIRAELDHLNYYYGGSSDWVVPAEAVIYDSKAKAQAALPVVIQMHPCEIPPDEIHYNVQSRLASKIKRRVIDKDNIDEDGYVYFAAATIKGMNDLYFGKGVWGPIEEAEFRSSEELAQDVLELAMDDFPAEYEIDFNNLFSYSVVPRSGANMETPSGLS